MRQIVTMALMLCLVGPVAASQPATEKRPAPAANKSEAAEMAEWQIRLKAELDEMKKGLETVPDKVADAMAQLIELKEAMIESLDERIKALKEADWDLLKKVDVGMKATERRLTLKQLDLDEARAISELQERARETGLDELDSLIAKTRNRFERRREIRREIIRLEQEDGQLELEQVLMMKRLEVQALEQEAERLNKERVAL